MTLVGCYPSCLNVLMQLAYLYLCNWRYQFSLIKISVAVFGESPAELSENKQTGNWSLGPDYVDEEDEYVNLRVYKNYCGSFFKNLGENIAKTMKKAGMLFSANFVEKCVKPMIYLKFWDQACIPTLLFGAEIWSLTSTDLEKLERCQRWFIKRLFHLPDYTSNKILAIVSGIPSVTTIINQKRLYFLGRIITLSKNPDVIYITMKAVMKSRLLDFFKGDDSSPHRFLHVIVCLLEKYELMTYVLFWKNSSLFPSYCKWKSIVNSRLFRMHHSQLQAVSPEVPNVKLVLSAFASMNLKAERYLPW